MLVSEEQSMKKAWKQELSQFLNLNVGLVILIVTLVYLTGVTTPSTKLFVVLPASLIKSSSKSRPISKQSDLSFHFDCALLYSEPGPFRKEKLVFIYNLPFYKHLSSLFYGILF